MLLATWRGRGCLGGLVEALTGTVWMCCVGWLVCGVEERYKALGCSKRRQRKGKEKEHTWISMSVCPPCAPPRGWWIIILEFGKLYLFPSLLFEKRGKTLATLVIINYIREGTISNTKSEYLFTFGPSTKQESSHTVQEKKCNIHY